jgi:hypothetical protein
VCSTRLDKGADALYDPKSRTIRCLECPPVGAQPPPAADPGVAGSSARRVFDRRRAAREARVKGRLGEMLGGVVLAITDEPQSTRAWRIGAIGEEKLASALSGVPGIRTLHDRSVPGTRGNIDHIIVAPAGVFVVDAKNYQGLIAIRDRGGLFHSDLRLFVGRRDCSRLAENMDWQCKAVTRVLEAIGLETIPPVIGVLCFVDGEWPLLMPPETFKSVRLEGTRSIRELIDSKRSLDPAAIARIAESIAAALPPK